MSAVPLVLVVLACGGDDTASPDGGPGLDAGSDDFHVDRVGVVNLMEGGSFLGVFASITDGPERPVPGMERRPGGPGIGRPGFGRRRSATFRRCGWHHASSPGALADRC